MDQTVIIWQTDRALSVIRGDYKHHPNTGDRSQEMHHFLSSIIVLNPTPSVADGVFVPCAGDSLEINGTEKVMQYTK